MILLGAYTKYTKINRNEMFKKEFKVAVSWILGMASGPKKVAPGSLQNIRTGAHFFCYFGSRSIVAYGKAWEEE